MSPFSDKVVDLRKRFTFERLSHNPDGAADAQYVGIGIIISREEWFEIAEVCVAKMCPDTGVSYHFMKEHACGMMGFVIGVTFDVCCANMGDKARVVQLICDHHKFSSDTIPPVLLVREMCSLWVRFRNVYEGVVDAKLVGILDSCNPIHSACADYENPDDAALIDREIALKIFGRLKENSGS